MKLKKELFKSMCEQWLEQKVSIVKEAIAEAQDSANAETKSSAGDKHETSRAMAQIETDRLGQQLHTLMLTRNALSQIDAQRSFESIGIGCYTETTAGNFYISVGLGEIKSDDVRFFAIAGHSPVGRQLMNKKAGETFSVGERQEKILAVY